MNNLIVWQTLRQRQSLPNRMQIGYGKVDN